MIRRHKIKIGLLLIIVAAISVCLFLKNNIGDVETSISEDYTAQEIGAALERLEKGGPEAQIIGGVNTDKRVIALTFKGMPEIGISDSLIQLMDDSHTKASFFLPGIGAMEDSGFVKKMDSMGFNIENGTLNGSQNMHLYSKEELIKDLVKSNHLIKDITGRSPMSVIFNSTEYTEDLLRSAYESGNKLVVDSTHVLNYQSFNSYEETLGYLSRIKPGSIITIKLDGVLDETEYQPPVMEDKPAEDKQPGIVQETEKDKPETTGGERLLNVIEWMLKAIEELEYDTLTIEDMVILAEEEKLEMVERPDEGNTPGSGSGGTAVKPEKGAYSRTEKAENNNDNEFNKYKIRFGRDELEDLRLSNKNMKAKEIYTVHTTETALSYSFYGISNKEALNDALESLDELDVKATFFVSQKDMENNSSAIRDLAQKGHEIGIIIGNYNEKDYYEALEHILKLQGYIKNITGNSPELFRYPYEMKLENHVLEAISTAGGTVVWQDISSASSKLNKDASANEVESFIFNQGNIFARRGYIIYFRLDYYNDPALIGNLIKSITERRIETLAYADSEDTVYSLKTIGAVMKGSKVYEYPVNPENMLNGVRGSIYEGHLSAYTAEEKLDYLKRRYIGNPNIKDKRTLPGFTDEELVDMDYSGRFTDDKVLFLTFDDWSSDKPINHILHVLRKHDIKAAFFIRTNYMQNNPNILRAIAEEGHDVGSHTDQHYPFALTKEEVAEDDTDALFYSISEEDALKRKEDLLISYNKLQSVIGDVSVSGKPALTKILRPPTLAMSKKGMEAIFDMGFTHIVSGDFSTGDYAMDNPEKLADNILNGMALGDGSIRTLQNGSILVLHMNDGNKELSHKPNMTAEALDIVIPVLKSQGYSFGRLSDYID